MNLLIKQSQILLPDGSFLLGDILLQQGKIAAISEQIDPVDTSNTEIINGVGLVLLPGVIDPQVHFREPGLEYKEDLHTASCACAKGGVTSFLEMPNTRPLTTTQAALDDKLRRAASKCVVNYGFFIGATGEVLPDLLTANPTCGIKVFMGSMHGALLIDQEEILDRIFAQGRRLIAVHAEDQARIAQRRQEFAGSTDPAIHSIIQDNQAALNATQLALKLSKKYQRRLHILHMSTAEEAELLRQDKPQWVTAEVTPQHLLMNIDAYSKIGSLAQMNPPLRSPHDQEVLWQALRDGVIDFIATDHAPHTLAEKGQAENTQVPTASEKSSANTIFLEPATIPSGMPGVETSLALMLTQAMAGRCTVAQVSRWMSSNVAKAYGIPNKGEIRVGWDADLVLVDLKEYQPVIRQNLLTKCGWSPFEGWNLTGWANTTIVGGNVVYANGKVNEEVRGSALKFT
ncbi:dihydroorotase, multifunctional complex type [Synechococcus sp. PCC 7502]|uniref:dihydroorotase n=1 Tax=Synechococcus sp. PCC 7502 TaxID=1173263 RepID=UPI00029FC239|nr:dihydroorotase [Synechococcus sp. PCC 7502]AFY74262.1 dihydroorotase, multifunctional complex type [Synechococcus sp. PCC 7502]